MRILGSCAIISTSTPIAHILADTSTESPPEDEVPAPLAGTAHPSRTAHLIPARPHHTPPRPVPNPRISEGNRHFQSGTRRKNRKHTACSLTSPGAGRGSHRPSGGKRGWAEADHKRELRRTGNLAGAGQDQKRMNAGRPGVQAVQGLGRCGVFCRVMRILGSCATISTSMPIAHTLADTSTESPGEESPARLISVPHLGPRPNPSPTPISRISEGNRQFQPGTRRKNRKHTACSLTSPGEGRGSHSRSGGNRGCTGADHKR